MYDIMHLPGIIEIGYTGENLFRTLEIDMKPWLQILPGGSASIVNIRQGDSVADGYVTSASMGTDGVLRWQPTAADLGSEEGYGQIQIYLVETEGGTTRRGKSAVVQTFVRGSIDSGGSTPEEVPSIIDQITAIKGEAETARDQAVAAKNLAVAALDLEPRIGDNLHWFTWETSGSRWVDTGVSAVGPQGPQGATGATGPQGPKGDPGDSGVIAPVQNGFYMLEVDTNGDLYVVTPGSDVPTFEYDSETGNLYYVYEEED